MNGFVFDIIFIVLILLFGLIGYFKGLFKSLTAMLGTGLAMTIVYAFRKQFLNLDQKIGIRGFIIEKFGEIASNIITLVCYGVILAILFKILALILNKSLGKIFEGKILGGVNRVLGMILGLFSGLMYTLTFVFILAGLLYIGSIEEKISKHLEGSIIVKPITIFVKDEVISKKLPQNDNNGANGESLSAYIALNFENISR